MIVSENIQAIRDLMLKDEITQDDRQDVLVRLDMIQAELNITLAEKSACNNIAKRLAKSIKQMSEDEA